MANEEQKINELITKLRTGEIDINNQSLFFSILIKGLMLKLNGDLTIRGLKIPHMILSTGDDTIYILNKGQDASIEPLEISNEDYIYNIIPRCIVNPGSIDVVPDQLTNPYARCEAQVEYGDGVYSISAECRRMPIKLSVSLKYYLNSYNDLLELTQEVISKLSFVQTYHITYMGQSIICSYKIPENLDGQHLAEMDGTTTDNKCRTLEMSLEVETNFPVYSGRTAVDSNKRIIEYITNLNF